MAVRYTAQKMVTAADRGVAADLIGHTPEIEEFARTDSCGGALYRQGPRLR